VGLVRLIVEEPCHWYYVCSDIQIMLTTQRCGRQNWPAGAWSSSLLSVPWPSLCVPWLVTSSTVRQVTGQRSDCSKGWPGDLFQMQYRVTVHSVW